MNYRVIWHRIKHWFYRDVTCRINPRQKWLTDKIGREFVDKDFIFETTLFSGMIHFWEEDNGESSTRYQFEAIEHPAGGKAMNPEDEEDYKFRRKIYRQLEECYTWAKMRDFAWEDFWKRTDVRVKEETLVDRDTEMMFQIIRLRKYIWT